MEEWEGCQRTKDECKRRSEWEEKQGEEGRISERADHSESKREECTRGNE